MMGLPFNFVGESDERIVCIRFETASHPHKNLEILADGKVVSAFNKEKYQQIFRAFCGFWDNNFPPKKLIINPIVTSYIHELVEEIRNTYRLQELPLIQKWFWPNGKTHAICISHDIDFLARQEMVKVLKSKIKHIRLIKFFITRALDQIFKINTSENFGDNVERILKLEKKLDLQSTFFIFSNLKTYQETAPVEGISNELFLKLIRTLNRASEVGVHGSMNSFKNIESLENEKEDLELHFKDVRGIRQHRLNFIPPLTWRYQAQAGYKYDSSISHSEFFGFSAGLCHPYRPIDILQKQFIDILEIPLSFSDWTFLHYKLNLSRSFSVFNTLNSICQKYNGVLVVNFHNLYFNPTLFPDAYQFYKKTCEYISKSNVWKPTLGQLYEWWIKRKQVELDVSYERKLNIELKTDVPVENLCINVGRKEFIPLNLEREYRLTV